MDIKGFFSFDTGGHFKTDACLGTKTLDCKAPTVAGELSTKPEREDPNVVAIRGLIILEPGGTVGWSEKENLNISVLTSHISLFKKKLYIPKDYA